MPTFQDLVAGLGYNPQQYATAPVTQQMAQLVGGTPGVAQTGGPAVMPPQGIVNVGGQEHSAGLIQHLVEQYGPAYAQQMVAMGSTPGMASATYNAPTGSGGVPPISPTSLTGQAGGPPAAAPTSLPAPVNAALNNINNLIGIGSGMTGGMIPPVAYPTPQTQQPTAPPQPPPSPAVPFNPATPIPQPASPPPQNVAPPHPQYPPIDPNDLAALLGTNLGANVGSPFGQNNQSQNNGLNDLARAFAEYRNRLGVRR